MSLKDSQSEELHQHHGSDAVPRAHPIDRREFLKLAGFSLTGAIIAGCQPAKVEKAIPFLIKPEEVTPGLAYWYATTCAGCSAGCGVLAKNRDGRPIKLEGNPDHPLSKGGLCAVGQASLLPLYDSQRLKNPLVNGSAATWEAFDASIRARLEEIKKSGGAVRVLTGSIAGPTAKAILSRFLAAFNDARHVSYDVPSVSAILDAHARTHGVRVLPRYDVTRAEVIASFDADFLGTWISPVEFTQGYRAGRTLEGTPPKFSYHIQIESRLSLTGSNADTRLAVAPTEIKMLVVRLASLIAQRSGATDPFRPAEGGSGMDPVNGVNKAGEHDTTLSNLADRLWKSRGKSLVMCGVNDLQTQLVVNYINHLLGNYGSTVDIERPSYQRQGSDSDLRALLDEMYAGKVAALFIHGVNPVYDLAEGEQFADALKKIPLVVSFAERVDETAKHAHFVCPDHHYLESWSDGEPVAGVVTVTQPVIAPLGKTRAFIESLAAWMGESPSAYDLIRKEWERTVFSARSLRKESFGPLDKRQTTAMSFQSFWDQAVKEGFAVVKAEATKKLAFNPKALDGVRPHAETTAAGEFVLTLYPSTTMFDGRHAHNPWLQELPDPVTKIVWDNYASFSPTAANKLGLRDGDVVRLSAKTENGRTITLELPAHVQIGQHDGTVAVALGYGRAGTDRFTNIGPQWLEAKPTVPAGGLVGKNAAQFVRFDRGGIAYSAYTVSVTKTGTRHTLACTQDHHSLEMPAHLSRAGHERRPIVQETSYTEFSRDPKSGSFTKHTIVSMWSDDHSYNGHHWGMTIDLTACTGCSACVVSCMAENNIPLVGKDEVARNREMTWIRIDRYYNDVDGKLSVAHQPMMCHHCDNAPCETVCPVLATVHSEEGLNQQVYNRCVGTRYCSNNCPYKVRRFNWFDYEHGDAMHKLVLNPDVTVRERGVMEKCSFCVQRIQEAKIAAKREGRKVKDGEIQPACAQSCPARAIVFGDRNDATSELVKRMKDPRHYYLLEEIGVKPSLGYLTMVRNREKGEKTYG